MTPKILTTKEVCQICRCSRQELWRRRGRCGFPQPIKLGARKVGFLEAEVAAWIDARRRERDARFT